MDTDNASSNQSDPSPESEQDENIDDWDIVSLPCLNCGSQDWSAAQVDAHAQYIIRCNRCPPIKVLH